MSRTFRKAVSKRQPVVAEFAKTWVLPASAGTLARAVTVWKLVGLPPRAL